MPRQTYLLMVSIFFKVTRKHPLYFSVAKTFYSKNCSIKFLKDVIAILYVQKIPQKMQGFCQVTNNPNFLFLMDLLYCISICLILFVSLFYC